MKCPDLVHFLFSQVNKMKFKLILPTRVDNPEIKCPICGQAFYAIKSNYYCPRCDTKCTEIIE